MKIKIKGNSNRVLEVVRWLSDCERRCKVRFKTEFNTATFRIHQQFKTPQWREKIPIAADARTHTERVEHFPHGEFHEPQSEIYPGTDDYISFPAIWLRELVDHIEKKMKPVNSRYPEANAEIWIISEKELTVKIDVWRHTIDGTPRTLLYDVSAIPAGDKKTADMFRKTGGANATHR